jgi:hypothetical protein
MANKYTATPIPSRLKEFYDSGLSQTEIAELFGVSQKIVWGWMKRADLKARVAAKRDQRGEKNAYWGGKDGIVGYEAYHYRVIARRGQPSECVDCGTTDPSKKYDWANLTGNYADVNDYKRLCRSCHSKLDRKILNIKKMREHGLQSEASSVVLADSTRV